jgi:hypothetical protein
LANSFEPFGIELGLGDLAVLVGIDPLEDALREVATLGVGRLVRGLVAMLLRPFGMHLVAERLQLIGADEAVLVGVKIGEPLVAGGLELGLVDHAVLVEIGGLSGTRPGPLPPSA